MCLLTDTTIGDLLITDKEQWEQSESINKEKLLIANYDPQSLTPIGYDLRVGGKYFKMYSKIMEFEDLNENNKELIISPKEIVAIKTEEYIGMPQSKLYSGILVSKVSIVEKGLSHISTSLDSDYVGELIITITNHSNRKVILEWKHPFCTMMLFKNTSPATKKCGKDPAKHFLSIIEEWKPFKKRSLNLFYIWILKVLISAIPLIWLLVKYLDRGVSHAEVALFVALSAALYTIFNSKPPKY